MGHREHGEHRGRGRRPGARLMMVLAALCPVVATAAVLDSAPDGFTVEQVRTLDASPEAAWRAFVEDVSAWYDAAHTYGGNGAALSIDARPGGCFCEALEGGPDAGVEHLRVVMVRPGRTLRMRGGLGPLQGLGVAGALTVVFEPVEAGGSIVRLAYRVGGYLPEGLGGWAEPVDGVLGGHMDRFQAHLAD